MCIYFISQTLAIYSTLMFARAILAGRDGRLGEWEMVGWEGGLHHKFFYCRYLYVRTIHRNFYVAVMVRGLNRDILVKPILSRWNIFSRIWPKPLWTEIINVIFYWRCKQAFLFLIFHHFYVFVTVADFSFWLPPRAFLNGCFDLRLYLGNDWLGYGVLLVFSSGHRPVSW